MAITEDRIKTLVEKLRDNDAAAFSELYALHFRPVFNFCQRFLKSRELAQDCAQLTFIKIWEVRNQLNVELNFKSYLFTICRNSVLKTIEKAARERTLKEKILAEYAQHDTAFDVYTVDEMEALAISAFEQLPPQRQIVFKLCRIEGNSYEKAAMDLGISTGTVRDHLFKASKTIRRYLSFNRLVVVLVVAAPLMGSM